MNPNFGILPVIMKIFFFFLSYSKVEEYPPEYLETGLTFVYAADDPSEAMKLEEIHVFSGSWTPTTINNIQCQLTLPAFSDTTGTSRASFIVYRKTTLFQSRNVSEFNQNATNVERIVNTQILSATIDGELSGNIYLSCTPVKTADDMVRLQSIPL